ncbi:hypothetical protein K501DRAFT_69962 [Backusella circina FSU 941]|nr:hypothetical protein K501DRAFT_69962 [Backusella circina FSU 941]
MDIKDYSMLQDDKLAKTINTIGQGLGSFLHRNFPDYYFEILPIGSRSYGAYSTSTDFNFCVIMDDPDLDWIAQNEDSIRHSQFLQPAESDHIALLLSKDPSFKKGSYDDSFNTLRYHDPIGHVEFVFNKKVYTESTELIMHYIGLDDRVGQLISVVRNFVQLRNVTKGGLHGAGFYQYCIMVLAYLQQLDPPIIPNLQHLGFGNTDCCRVPNCRTNRKYWDVALSHKVYVGGAPYYHTCVTKDITMPETRNYVQQDGKGGYYWNSSNNAKISELLLGFFYYYGYEFNFKRNGVSLKNGGVVAKNNNTVYFYIEDPFLTGVN